MNYELKDSLLERYDLMAMIALGEIIADLYGMVNHVESKVLSEFDMGIAFFIDHIITSIFNDRCT